jgi:hypothetical protein
VVLAAPAYGLLAVLVGSRTREIGVRPLSAHRPHRWRGEWPSTAFAMPSSASFSVRAGPDKWTPDSGLLVGVSARNPITLLTVVAVLLAVAACASIIPARRGANRPAAACERSNARAVI